MEDYRLHHKDADEEWLCHFSLLLSSSSSLWLAAAAQIVAELGLGFPSSVPGCTQAGEGTGRGGITADPMGHSG